MKATFARLMLIAVFVRIAAGVALAEDVGAPEPGGVAKGEELGALEQKLVGVWKGGACMGDYTFNADGTFEVEHFTPGNNRLTGIWSVRWEVLPPTLVMTCKTTDDAKRLPVGKISEVKLIRLEAESLATEYAGSGECRFARVSPGEVARQAAEEELAALAGTWTPLDYEEGGKKAAGEFNFRQIVKGDRVIFQVNGETKAEGKVVVDATKNPKQLDFRFTSGQTDLIIYTRVGGSIIYCGNRDGRTRPTEFVSGTPRGGAYLMAWKIER